MRIDAAWRAAQDEACGGCAIRRRRPSARAALLPCGPRAAGPTLEPLEPRILLAAIGGTVFQDLDRDGLRDPGEPGAAAVTIELFTTPARATGGLPEDRVLVVHNSARADSLAVYRHYQSSRPGVLGLDLADAALAPGDISYADFVARIRDPIRQFLLDHGLAEQVVVLILTRGLPHRILDMGGYPQVGDNPVSAAELVSGGNATYSTVDSELTLLWQDLRLGPQLGERGRRLDSFADNYVLNPYQRQSRSIARQRRSAIERVVSFEARDGTHWAWRRSGAGFNTADAGRIYLTARLDGPTLQSVLDMIDRARSIAYRPALDRVLFDKRSTPDLDGGDYDAARARLASTWPRLTFDDTAAFLVGQHDAVADPAATSVSGPVAALVTYGANHGNASQQGYESSFADQLVNGAIMLSFESFNARAFGGLGGFQDQGQLSAWVAAGGTLGVGTAWEPLANGVTSAEPVLANFLLEGLTWVEAAWSGIGQLSWPHVVLGDPLAVAAFVAAPPVRTDINGEYRFEDLGAGNYQVRVDAPADFTFSPAGEGRHERADSDVDARTGRSAVFRARSGTTIVDAAMFEQAAVPALSLADAAGSEDVPVMLTIGAASTDADGTETLTIRIGGMPDGAALSAGSRGADGTWSLLPAQLGNLTLSPPPDRDGTFTLTVEAIATEPVGGDRAVASGTIRVALDAVADPPTLRVTDAAGPRGGPIALSIDAAPLDTDGSESVSVCIAGLPGGALLSAGAPSAGGVWTVSAADLAGMMLTLAAERVEPLTLSIRATSVEAANGAIAATASALTVGLFTVATLGGAIEDHPLVIPHDMLVPAARAAGLRGSPLGFVIDSVLGGALDVDTVPVVPGQTTLEAGSSLTWRPAANASGALEAFRVRAVDGAGTALLQFDVATAAVNDPPAIAALEPEAPVWALGDPLRLSALGAADVDDADLTVQFYLDTDGDGLVGQTDMLLGEVGGPAAAGLYSAEAPTSGLALGRRALLAVAVDGDGAVSPAVGAAVVLAEVLGGPRQQNATSSHVKRIAAPFGDDLGQPLSIELRGPGTVELLVDGEGEDQFRKLTVRSSDATSSLTVRGRTFLTGVLAQGSLGALAAADVALRGRLEVAGALRTLNLGAVAAGHEIRIGPGDVSTRIVLGEVVDLVLVSGSPIATLAADSWLDLDSTPDVLEAPSLGRLEVGGDFDAALTLDADLGRVDIGGSLGRGTWRVAGGAARIRAGSIGGDWSAHFGGAVGHILVDGGAAGRISAASIGQLTVRGDLDGGARGALLRLTESADPLHPRRLALGRLVVGGSIGHLELRSAGHIGAIRASAIRASLIFAGVDDAVNTLPAGEDFVGQAPARLESLSIAGRRGAAVWLSDTRIAASRLGTVRFGFADPGVAGDPFGISTAAFDRLIYRDGRGVHQVWTPEQLGTLFPIGRLEVRVV